MKEEVRIEKVGCPNVDDEIIVRYDGKNACGAKLERPNLLHCGKFYAFSDGFARLTLAVIHGCVLCYVELYKANHGECLTELVMSGFLESGVFNNPAFSSFDDCLVTLKKDGCSLRITYTD